MSASAAGGTITVTVKCKDFPRGDEIVELPSTATVLQLKEHYHELYGFGTENLQVAIPRGGRGVVHDDQATLSSFSSVSKSVTVNNVVIPGVLSVTVALSRLR